MLNLVDNFLNKVTMYRLLLYVLSVFVATAIILSMFELFPYSTLDILKNLVVLLISCYYSNKIFAKILKIPTNIESDYITAFILTLIITPDASILFLILAGVFSQTAKYILNFRGKHIFNPAAVAMIATIIFLGEGASWWIGNVYLLLFVVVGGLLVVRKIQRFDLVLSFLVVYFATLIFSTSTVGPVELVRLTLINSAILYFAFIMLTEPSTSPPTKPLRIAYGALVGLLFGTGFSFGQFYASPELALVLGNIFSFLVSNKVRYKMTLKEKKEIAPQTYSFVFEPNRKLAHEPGQYLEWTIGHKKPDTRGNRRYFTVASSPTEKHVDLGVKFYDKPSTFKRALMSLNVGNKVFAGQLTGDFTLPKDQTTKLVFIAGGIGITPFRSILKYLLDKNEKREIVFFYSVKNEDEIAYKDVLSQASEKLGIKVIYVITDKAGLLTSETIKHEVHKLGDSIFYVSGPRGMVTDFEKILKEMGIPGRQIKIDFFPGYV